MRLSDAWALVPTLAIQPRDTAREARQLEALACWAGGFTSEVSLAAPDALLLEIAGSLRLFGGLDALLEQVCAGIAAQGHVACLALAPTPRAARWLSAVNDDGGEVSPRCHTLDALHAALASLPVPVLELPPAQARRVLAFGARCLGDLLPLPRAGLVRRLGADFGLQLAQALGEVPDPQPRFRFPESFRAALELPARVEDAPRLLFAAQRLLAMLCGWLAARGCGVALCRLQLTHEDRRSSDIELSFATLTRDAERILRVLRERLERLSLVAPVEALTLLADAPEALPGRDGVLFSGGLGEFDAQAAADGVAMLVERLQARLGRESVHGLAAIAEHRPEQASRIAAPGGECAGSDAPVPAAGPRPTWLLPEPQALREIDGRPQRDGPLTLLAGPERIESGWWDAGEHGATGDVRRDYFVALTRHREWLWIFRSEHGWFLHGFYA